MVKENKMNKNAETASKINSTEAKAESVQITSTTDNNDIPAEVKKNFHKFIDKKIPMQGVLLDFRTKYTYGGDETDSGSGCGKFVDEFIKEYCFGAHREKDRTMVSDLIKEASGMTDEEYIKFVEENQNKQWSEIQPPELRNKLIKALADGIVSTERGYKRSYDEFYGSNPERVMATFAYNEDAQDLIGNGVEFVNKNNRRLSYLIQFNKDHNIPMVLMGD